MKRNEEHYSGETWWVTGINIVVNILLVAKCFVATAGTFLREGSGTAPILQRKLYGTTGRVR